ncbi:hypothetical protein BGP78_01600 [Pseudoalteromonas sp. MSK9-3]|uniref:scabin-related ADP-ribosyltransferase n=1 Tax=Pseudoalteromonas sp. MSK9-3 TaxID=1897633 RepID=UPI000E6C4316|nr:hypothetical protein [Pseudoalteromonas sp. MSK9-3]RJE76968.1 hypothetical protein BGP78_01600 [Pseudoalteromonas sp. MSK9-3]
MQEQEQTVYRGDKRSPEVVFSDGFKARKPKDGSVTLQEFWDNNTPSRWISTTVDWFTARKFSIPKGNTYEIRTADELIPATTSKFNEAELTAKDIIKNTDIRYNLNLFSGYKFNPYYKNYDLQHEALERARLLARNKYRRLAWFVFVPTAMYFISQNFSQPTVLNDNDE